MSETAAMATNARTAIPDMIKNLEAILVTIIISIILKYFSLFQVAPRCGYIIMV